MHVPGAIPKLGAPSPSWYAPTRNQQEYYVILDNQIVCKDQLRFSHHCLKHPSTDHITLVPPPKSINRLDMLDYITMVQPLSWGVNPSIAHS